MNKNTYLTVTGVIFLVVALVHLYRVVTGLAVQFGSVNVPVGLSWLGLLIAGFLSYSAFKLRNR